MAYALKTNIDTHEDDQDDAFEARRADILTAVRGAARCLGLTVDDFALPRGNGGLVAFVRNRDAVAAVRFDGLGHMIEPTFQEEAAETEAVVGRPDLLAAGVVGFLRSRGALAATC